jgi:Fuc2NAc and GlcNAc transferase
MANALIVVGACGFLASLVLTGLLRRYAVILSLLDYPNSRSSHTEPTPRGGGLAIVLIIVAGLAILADKRIVAYEVALALLGGGAMVAVAGWVDDRRGLLAPFRLLAHVAAGCWTVWWLGGMPTLMVGSYSIELGFAGSILAVLGIVWAVNFYNFMDGIDGLAAGEAASVGLLGAVLLAPWNPSLAVVAALVAGSAAGFLPFNWAPARIFMGDVGSGFFGFLFAALAVASERVGALPALIWLLLLGVFFADATITLLRRLVRGEKWYAPHRLHAYQRAVQGGWSHAGVTGAVLGLNAGLGVMAWRITREPELLFPMLGGAGVVLAIIYLVLERWSPMPSRSSVPAVEKPVR